MQKTLQKYCKGTGDNINLTLMPPPTAGVYSIFAVVKAPKNGVEKWNLAGRLDVQARTPKTYSVTLVPLATGHSIDEGNVRENLNDIWNQYGISWEVDVDEEFYVHVQGDDGEERKQYVNEILDGDWTKSDNWLSEYKPVQKAINSTYNTYASSQNTYDNTRMYVFVLPADKAPYNNQIGDMFSETRLSGVHDVKSGRTVKPLVELIPMNAVISGPLGKQWGYLFVDNFGSNNSHYRTLSHELGHVSETRILGACEPKCVSRTNPDERSDIGSKTELQHTFAGDHLEERTTSNLMDYGTGTDLVRFQWEAIHNPAIIGKVFQSDEDGAYRQGYYVAKHEFSGDCTGGANIDENFITYYAPSGLPFSLPKSVCQEKHSGKLYLADSDEFIKVPEKCLTSFRLDDVVYEAFALDHEFIGYIPFPTGNVDAPLLDENTIQNLGTIELYDLTDSYINRSHVYYSKLEGFEGGYFAQGPIVEEDGDVLRCLKCQMPIEDCYCGRACVCYADHSQMHGNENCNLQREFYGYKGIPIIKDGKLERIEMFYPSVNQNLKKEQITHNMLLNIQCLELYYYKLGVDPPYTYKDVVSMVGRLSNVLEMTVDNVQAKKIFQKLNGINSKYDIFMSIVNIDNALADENYPLAFYEAVKLIPGIGTVVGTTESVLGVVYSKEFMTVLYNSARNQKNILYATGGSSSQIAEMEKFEKIAEVRIKALQIENNRLIHNRICTCK